MQEKNSSKIRYVKIQSATDRSEPTDSLSSFTIDLTEASFLQNCVAVQFISCGFTHLSPNVNEFSNTIVLQTADSTLYTLTVPPAQYTIQALIDELNSLPSSVLNATWSFNGSVQLSTAVPCRVMSVVENSLSSLAPLLGFQGYTGDSFFPTQLADTQPGLVGLTTAFLHIQPVATRQSVAISSTTKTAIQVSVIGQIPCNVPLGQYTFYDASKSGDVWYIPFEQERDISRFQVRLRNGLGQLIPVCNPGVELIIKLFLR
jgi:hypothetical protein